MEAKTLNKKKTTINKGKLKKTIKNVLCRPDPVFWPVVSTDDVSKLENALAKYKVSMPDFKKPYWKELKSIPKDKRLKPPVVKKVDGLLFGISECLTNLQKGKCCAIIIDSGVNPQVIVQPTIESCIAADLPVVCMSNLRKTCFENFAITTSCLGVKSDHLIELKNEILEIAKCYRPPKVLRNKDPVVSVDVEASVISKEAEVHKVHVNKTIMESPYLYRTNKKTRVFVPSDGLTEKVTKAFIGQDFIELSDKPKQKKSSTAYMNMILKRIANNPNRVKGK